MGAVFFSSDHHTRHEAINDLCDRPFSSTEECLAEMTRRHNKRYQREYLDAGVRRCR